MFGASAEFIPDRLLGCYYSVPKWEKQYIVAVGWHYLIHPATADAGGHVRSSPAAAAIHHGARWRPLRSRGTVPVAGCGCRQKPRTRCYCITRRGTAWGILAPCGCAMGNSSFAERWTNSTA